MGWGGGAGGFGVLPIPSRPTPTAGEMKFMEGAGDWRVHAHNLLWPRSPPTIRTPLNNGLCGTCWGILEMQKGNPEMRRGAGGRRGLGPRSRFAGIQREAVLQVVRVRVGGPSTSTGGRRYSPLAGPSHTHKKGQLAAPTETDARAPEVIQTQKSVKMKMRFLESVGRGGSKKSPFAMYLVKNVPFSMLKKIFSACGARFHNN